MKTAPHAAWLALALSACAMPVHEPAGQAAALARAVAARPIVLLGEVHDNAAQHALRARALRTLLEQGARPALAFEQFDADRQGALDAARQDTAGDAAARADRIIAAAGARGWDWNLYRPYVMLALEFDLPIVAANLSRAQAMRVAQEGPGVLGDPARVAALGLDHVPADVQQGQEREIARSHCGKVPAEAVPAMALAQIARDAVLAQALLPYADRGVVLLTGNGHVRRDLGVPRHLPPALAARTEAIGLLEDENREPAQGFDAIIVTATQPREDPCTHMHAPAMKG